RQRLLFAGIHRPVATNDRPAQDWVGGAFRSKPVIRLRLKIRCRPGHSRFLTGRVLGTNLPVWASQPMAFACVDLASRKTRSVAQIYSFPFLQAQLQQAALRNAAS